jgi:hypothetical protein
MVNFKLPIVAKMYLPFFLQFSILEAGVFAHCPMMGTIYIIHANSGS